MAHLIDKSALVAEIKRRKKYNHERAYLDRSSSMAGREEEDKDILSIIDTFEVKEEPVSEELEEAAIEYCGGNKGSDARVRTGFIMGAKWKEKQMMSKAVDAHVNYAWSGLSFGGFDWSKTGLDIGDKCKLIIIKED